MFSKEPGVNTVASEKDHLFELGEIVTKMKLYLLNSILLSDCAIQLQSSLNNINLLNSWEMVGNVEISCTLWKALFKDALLMLG